MSEELKLFEYRQALECVIVVAARSDTEARKELEGLEKAWIETGDFIGVQEEVPELVDVRECENPDCDAHIIAKRG